MVIIDVHAHCIPNEFRGWLDRSGPTLGAHVVSTPGGQCVRFERGQQTGPQYSWKSLTDTKARLAEMDRMGIDIQLIAGWADLSGYEIASEHALEYAKVHNESLAAEAAKAPGRLRPIGTVPVQDGTLAVTALEHAMDDLGMVGVQLSTRVGDRFLDTQPGLDEFWSAAEAKGAFMVLHPVRPLMGTPVERYFMDNSVARPAETSMVLAGLIFSGVLERHPGLKICAVHGGGFLPYQIGRLDKAHRQAPTVAGKDTSTPPSETLSRTYVDTVVHDPITLRYTIDRMGVDKVLLGTDYPFPMGDQDPVSLVRSVPGLDKDEIQAIVGENAERLFPREP